MKRKNHSEHLLLEEVTQAGLISKKAVRALSTGYLMKLIRSQLNMSQSVVATRAGVPQSTISRLEKGEKEPNLSTLDKVFDALCCDLVLIPVLREPVDTLRQKQASKQAKKQMRYLQGTMNLEEQEPDALFLDCLLKEEQERLLQGPGNELWKE